MLWYKLNGTWQTWNYLHNTLGYSEIATVDVSYKGAGLNDWGQSVTTGYLDGVVTDFLSGTMFASGKVGWYSLNGMATECKLYPSQATDDTLFGPSGGSPAACLICNGVSYYLIRDALNLGWMTESECEDNGWVRGAPVCGDMGADYSNSMLSGMPDRILNGTISFTGELRENVMPESGRSERGTISFTGELRENVIPGSGTVEEYAPHIIVLLGLKYRSGAFSLENFNYTGSNNYWWSGFVDADNKQAALDFGCRAISNVGNPCPLQNLVYQPDTFNYEILGLYSDIDGTIPVTEFDLIDFSVTGSGTAEIFCSKQYSSSITAMTWRCKITKK